MIMLALICIIATHSTLSASTLHDAQELRKNGNFMQACSTFESLVATNPNDPTILFEYGAMLADRDELAYYQQAHALMKQSIALHYDTQRAFTFATFCCRIGAFEDSINTYNAILLRHPNNKQVLYNSGFTLKTAGFPNEALEIYKKVLALDPDYEQAHLGIAFTHLMKGDYATGWKAHVYNLKKQGKNSDALRDLIAHNNLAHKKILLRPEGGIGDTFNFIRYAQLIHAMHAHVTVAVQKELIPLLAGCPYIDQFITLNDPIPAHDASATLMSLPAIFGHTEEQIPQNIPYIFPNTGRVTYWRDKLAHDTNIKIGICWQPNVHNDISRLPIARRGIPLSYFYDLGRILGVSVYSLQQREGLDQLALVPCDVTIHTFNETFDSSYGSFMDSAAVMQQLDLIISTDTATAHLAGALGKPVWLLLPFSTDWRWLHNRTDSPWYPTMRIFKQTSPFDWDEIMKQLYTQFRTTMIPR